MVAPKLRFKEFDGDWSASNLEQTTQYFKGFAFKSESYKEDGIRIIRVSDLDKDSIKYQNEAIFLDKIEAQNYLNWEVKKKDIIVTTVGSKPHLIDSAVGRPIFVKNDSEGLLNQNLLVLRPKNENIDAYFIFSQLLDKKYLTHIETIQRGNANQSNITVKDLQEFEVFQTSKEEQTKIASFLSAVDEKISQLTKKNQLLSQYKQGMMQKLFSQQLRFKADDGSEFGEWEFIKLNQLGKSYNGLTGKTKDDFGNGDAYVTYKQIFDNRKINLQKIDKVNIQPHETQNRVIKGDLFFTTSSEIPEEVAYCSAILDDFDYPLYLNSFCFGFRPNNQNQLNSNYASFFFRSNQFRNTILHLAQGSTRFNISKTAFMDMKIALPRVEEQTKVANFLSVIDQKIEVVAQQIEQAKQWKKGLLQQMFV